LDDERRALSAIFKRGTEAYLVLTDSALRGHYDTQLAVRPDGRPPRMTFSSLARSPSRQASSATPLDDAVRSSAARPFARRAEELLRKGDLQQAKLQLVMATHRDPGNEILLAALKDVEVKLAAPKHWRG
jgi:curved DNA-binding protein CbpA